MLRPLPYAILFALACALFVLLHLNSHMRSELVSVYAELSQCRAELTTANDKVARQNEEILALAEAAAAKDEVNRERVEVIQRTLPITLKQDLATTKDAAELNHWLQELYR